MSWLLLRPVISMHGLNMKFEHCYMFRHYHVILRQLEINTLPSYTGISNAAVGNTIYNEDVSHRFYANLHKVLHIGFMQSSMKPMCNILIVNCIRVQLKCDGTR